MKRYIRTVLLCSLAAVLFISCTGTPSKHGDLPTEAAAITLKTQYSVYAADTERIWYTIENTSGTDAEFGSPWAIEYLDGDTWMTLPLKFDAWNAILHILPDDSCAAFSVDLSSVDAKIREGAYRIVRMINDTPHAAEFRIGDSVYTKASPHGYPPLTADGTASPSTSAQFAAFANCVTLGMPGQLRAVTEDTNGQTVYDLVYEAVHGKPRYTCTVLENGTVSTAYYSFLLYRDDALYLSSMLPLDGTAVLFPIAFPDITDGADSRSALLSPFTADVQRAHHPKQHAIYWSPDGMRSLSLFDEDLTFGVDIRYPDGGESGSMSTLTEDLGMKRITSVLWQDAKTALLICEPKKVKDMIGYVFLNTDTSEVLSYTYSQHVPKITPDGILIPE